VFGRNRPVDAALLAGDKRRRCAGETRMGSEFRVWPGSSSPLGATWDGSGTNFALFSSVATRVELCLFDSGGEREIARIPLPEMTHETWHGYLPDVRPGQLYGYRVHGPYEPPAGHRCNPNKLLIDPYARALAGELVWDDALYGYTIGHPDADLSFDERDSAAFVPRSVVVDTAHTWGPTRRYPAARDEMVVYEMHVRGMTMRHPGVPEADRGTFAGLAAPPVARHLRDLGVTAVELLPVCTPSCTTATWPSAARRTTGATTASASSRRTPNISAPAASWTSRPSSRSCTTPISR